MAQRYRETVSQTYLKKIRMVKKGLPPYAKNYIDSKADSMEVRSRYEYARDLTLFFKYLQQELPECENINIEEIPLKTIEEVSPELIDSYKEYLTLYTSADGWECRNGESGKSRKLAVLRSFYKYLNKRSYISTNPAALVDMPKKHKNEIITLTAEQEAELLAAIDDSTGKSPKEKELYERNHLRDKAIVLMLLGTGMRISELAGLDLDDINLKERTAKIIRKGGNHDTVYFSEQVEKALREYLRDTKKPGTRLSYNPAPDEKALFITVRKKRYSVRSLQNMVKTYARDIFGEETRLSAHKLRATFGSALYRDTHDIKLCAEALHHKSVATTEKFYVAFDEERKKEAARTMPVKRKGRKNKSES